MSGERRAGVLLALVVLEVASVAALAVVFVLGEPGTTDDVIGHIVTVVTPTTVGLLTLLGVGRVQAHVEAIRDGAVQERDALRRENTSLAAARAALRAENSALARSRDVLRDENAALREEIAALRQPQEDTS